MAQKAAKQLAVRNAAVLRRLHLMSLGVNGLFILLRFILFRSSATRSTYLLYLSLSVPAFAIELWFERNSRPTYTTNGDLKRAGDDLEAKGLTDYMSDVLYWTWITTAAAAVFGDSLVVVGGHTCLLCLAGVQHFRQHETDHGRHGWAER